MNAKRFVFALLGAFSVFFILEMLIHGSLLAGMYAETASIWRAESEMTKMMPYMTLGQFLFSIMLVIVYIRGYEPGKGTIIQGLRFGIVVALLLAPMGSLMWYAVLPIPSKLALAWLLTGFVEYTFIGMIIGALYKE